VKRCGFAAPSRPKSLSVFFHHALEEPDPFWHGRARRSLLAFSSTIALGRVGDAFADTGDTRSGLALP
jgi:hypothetical protein